MNTVPVQRRVSDLDVLRGVAIFGMFSVNMTAEVFWFDLFGDLPRGSTDHLVLSFIELFGSGNFITIFSFLFGVGFYVQSERRIAGGHKVPTFWLRRLGGLLVIGLIANACTLQAWILVDYAMFGLGLLLFYKLSPRWLFVAAMACILIPKIYGTVIPAYWPDPQGDLATDSAVQYATSDSPDYIRRYGGFLEISRMTLGHLWSAFTNWRYYLGDLDLLGLMLLGLYVGRIGAIWNGDRRRAVAKQLLPWLFGIGFSALAIWLIMSEFDSGDEFSPSYGVILSFLYWPAAKPVLGLGYAAAIFLLVDKDSWRRFFALFEPIGRMALTNYLFTCFVQALLNYQWGFGLYSEYFPAVGLFVAVACLPLQIVASRWWLDNFALGPFEWLWRSWTYRRLLPIRQQEFSS